MNDKPQYSDEDIARAWVQRFSKERTRILLVDTADKQLQDEQRIKAETKWAFKEVEQLVQNDPAHAWAVIIRILGLAQEDEDALDNLAAGPLESLLVRHGPDVIGWIEREAGFNPAVKHLLPGVWGDAIDPAVWTRLEALMPSDSKGS